MQRRALVQTTLPFDYELKQAHVQPARELVLALHGYGQSGARIFSKLHDIVPEGAALLAPNAPFPMVRTRQSGAELAYSWYFYDSRTDDYLIDMEPALQFLANGIKALGLEALPLRIVGFSQGGYLAPFVAQRLAHTRQVIGVASEFLHAELAPGPIPFRMDAVHGEKDDTVDPANARRSHELLRSTRQVRGAFELLPEVEHRFSAEVRVSVQRLLRLA